MRLALYLLNYKLWCDRMGFDFDARSANSVAINYKSFRQVPSGRKGIRYSIREVIKLIRAKKGENQDGN